MIIFNKKTALMLGISIFLSIIHNQAYSAETTTTSLEGASEKAEIEKNKTPSEFPVKIAKPCKLISAQGQSLNSLCTTATEDAQSCNESFVPAGTMCNPDTNANLMQQTALIQGLLSTAQGLTDSCSTFSKAMDLGKLAMAGYTTYCSAKRQICESSCSSSINSMKALAKAASTLSAKLATTSCTPAITSECEPETKDKANIEQIIALVEAEEKITPTTISSKFKTCKIDMLTLLGMAGTNVLALAQSKATSDKCDEATKANAAAVAVDCTKEENKSKTECLNKSTVVDCGLTANADKPICICKANPRVTGCEGVSTVLATNSTMSTGSDGTTSGRGANGKLTAAPGAATDKKFPADLSKTSKNDGSGIGGGGGGSTAGLSANSDVGSSDGTKLEKSENAGNANILSNESGGGSGYRFGFGGSSGSKAQLRKLAGDNGFKGKLTAQDWSAQVTSNGGKSNFDKVKVRYIENRTSLLNR